MKGTRCLDQELLHSQQWQSMPPYTDEMHVIKVVNSHSDYYLDWGQNVHLLANSIFGHLSVVQELSSDHRIGMKSNYMCMCT